MRMTYDNVLLINNLFNDIVFNYGQSPYYDDYPELILTYDKSYPVYGEFCTETLHLVLNLGIIRGWKDLVETMLHEYCHYLQNPHSWEEEKYEARARLFERDYVLFRRKDYV